jgi:cell division protein FtsB
MDQIEDLKKEIEKLKKRVEKLETGHTYDSSPDMLFENAIELLKVYDEVSRFTFSKKIISKN